MKIAYNWLKNYIATGLAPEETGRLLTDCGLEVESIEKFQSVKGGLEGLVIGEVKTKEKHPDADRLSLTTVDVGGEALLNIVCGAPNVEAGQKVVVAMIGAKLFPTSGESFEIKKSKIRGHLSEGMICAEDEIGFGSSHDGIMILDKDAVVGTSAKEYFKIEDDTVFEIGLTPNRADAASHIGVARDLVAVLNCKKEESKNEQNRKTLQIPAIDSFKVDNTIKTLKVIVEDAIACPRYSGLSISGIEVKESPDWLKNRLKSIGLKPINNIVDVTNFVLHETGQPLHAFDAGKIKGDTVIVKKLSAGTKFKTLDGVERTIGSEDLMICNAEEPMCIAGVFGGIESGVSNATQSIFLESASFNSVSVRKTSKLHGLKTDASFRFERGSDPNITVYALKRAALLIKEIAGGVISSEIIDIYPAPVQHFSVPFSYANCNTLIGKEIDRTTIKNILTSLEIEIVSEDENGLNLSVPPFKPDVQREVDVIEEVLRIYGYNNIELPDSLKSAISFTQKPDKEKIQNSISDLLSSNGFTEIMTTSLTKSEYMESVSSLNAAANVKILNPLSSDLNVLRQSLLFSGLEAIAYNQNRKNSDLKLYEFGKTYHLETEKSGYKEVFHLALFMTGRKYPESWNTTNDNLGFFDLKGFVHLLLSRLGIATPAIADLSDEAFSSGISYEANKKKIVEFGTVKKSILKKIDIDNEVFYADFYWENIFAATAKNKIQFKDVPKFPSVRRDLALLINKEVAFSEIEQLAFQTERNLLKKVNLFDVYEEEKLGGEKKSYAVSFLLQDEQATLTDKQIDKIMEKLIKTYTEKLGASIR